jgi:hypothetical protein
MININMVRRFLSDLLDTPSEKIQLEDSTKGISSIVYKFWIEKHIPKYMKISKKKGERFSLEARLMKELGKKSTKIPKILYIKDLEPRLITHLYDSL